MKLVIRIVCVYTFYSHWFIFVRFQALLFVKLREHTSDAALLPLRRVFGGHVTTPLEIHRPVLMD